MKKSKLLFSGLTCLAILAFLAGIIHYAVPTHTPLPQEKETRAENATEIFKKKSCRCCAERTARLQERIRKARERQQAARHVETKGIRFPHRELSVRKNRGK